MDCSRVSASRGQGSPSVRAGLALFPHQRVDLPASPLAQRRVHRVRAHMDHASTAVRPKAASASTAICFEPNMCASSCWLAYATFPATCGCPTISICLASAAACVINTSVVATYSLFQPPTLPSRCATVAISPTGPVRLLPASMRCCSITRFVPTGPVVRNSRCSLALV